MSDSLAASLQRFKQCTDTWKKLSEQGAQVLLAIQLEHIELLGESPEITVLLDNYKKLLDEMYQEYDRAVQINQSLKTEINGQATIDILSKQLAMYDEEYMLKTSIRAILRQPGFVTQKHLTGCIALWQSDIYTLQ